MISSLKLEELKHLKVCGLKTSGRKAELVEGVRCQ